MRKVDIVENLRKVRSYGINTWVNYMLAAPESTLQDDLSAIELSHKADVTYSSFSITVPMDGTALFAYCQAKNLINPLVHSSDMSGCTEPSRLPCFSRKDKKIRYNIFLLGAIIAKLPSKLMKVAMCFLKVVPPNFIYKKLRELFYRYSIENTIFRISS